MAATSLRGRILVVNAAGGVLVDSAGYSFEKTGSPKPTKQMLSVLNPSTIEGTKAVMGIIFANKSMVTQANAEFFLAQHMKKNDGYTIDQFIDSILRGEDVLDGGASEKRVRDQISTRPPKHCHFFPAQNIG